MQFLTHAAKFSSSKVPCRKQNPRTFGRGLRRLASLRGQSSGRRYRVSGRAFRLATRAELGFRRSLQHESNAPLASVAVVLAKTSDLFFGLLSDKLNSIDPPLRCKEKEDRQNIAEHFEIDNLNPLSIL